MKLRKREAFTLIEAILSIVLLGIISITILPMSINAVKFAKWNTIRQNAMNMTYTQIEWLKTLDYYTELELKGRFFPPDKFGYVNEGIVEESLFMNKTDTNSKQIDGIEYKILTNIYWEDGASSTGEYIVNALRKVDVTVTARDPFSGIEKEYSIIGTLIAFEGERKVDKTIPFKIKAFTGHDFTELIKNVKVEIYNETGSTLKNWGRTDEKGEMVIVGLANGKYRVIATEWPNGEIMSKPTGLEGTTPNNNWAFFDLVELKKTTESNPYVDHDTFVDYPGYIKVQDVHEDIMNNNELILKPNHNPPEGVILDLNLHTNLNKLDTLKIWRAWKYEYSLKHNSTEYKFVEEDTKNLWDGRFQYNKNGITIKKLTLGYIIGSSDENSNIYEKISNKLALHIVFPITLEEENIISSIKNKKFSLYDENIEIPYDIVDIQKTSDSSNKYIIEITTNYNIANGEEIQFMLNESIADVYGVDIVSDLRYVMLKQK